MARETKVITKKDPFHLVALLGLLAVGTGIALLPPPFKRGFEHKLNKFLPNEILAPPDLTALKRREQLGEVDFYDELKARGIESKRGDALYRLTERLLEISELEINSQIKRGAGQ